MGVIFIKKKKGTSFLEIIIALSIVGIISVAIFNNIYFSLKVNKEIDGKQNSSILAQHVFEEIKNTGENNFKEFIESIGNTNPNDSDESFLGSEFLEISSGYILDELEKYGLSRASSKVFNKEDTEFFVVIEFPKLKAGSVNEDKKINNDTSSKEWKNLKECEVGMEIYKEEGIYKVKLAGNPHPVFQGTKDEIIPKVILEENELEVYLKKNRILKETITKGNIFIKDNTGEDFSYIVSNNGSINLNLYVEQKTIYNSNFITYGSNIKVYSNDSEKNPDGENITTDSLYDFNVTVFREHGNNITKMIELKGHKKIKRFEV